MGFVRKIARKIDDEILQPIKHTVEAILDDPKKIAMVALSVFAPGVGTALGSAMGLSGSVATLVGNAAVNTALNGGDVKAGILAAAIPVVGQEAASLAASSFIDAGMDTALAQSAGKVVAGTGLAAAQGKDPLAALISGGLSEGTAAITRDIPGFADLPDAAKRSINAAVATELSGGDGTQAAINAAMSAGINSLTNYTNSLNPAPADAVNQLKDAGPKEEDLPYLPTDDDFVPTNEIEKPEEKAPDVVDQLLNSGMPSPDEDFVPTLPAETQTPTGPGYYDEITGEFIPDENGGLQGPLGPETGNFDPNQQWEYSLTRPGVWTNNQGEEIDLSYMPDRDTAMTGAELMERAGASPGAFRAGIRPPQGGGSGGSAPRPGGQPRPTAGGGAGAAAGIIGGILGGGAGGVNAGDPKNPPASRNPAVDTIAGLASQQQQNSLLNMMMNDKSEGAKIKSYKELFGEGLFGDTYVPPSARGYEPAQQPQFQSQDDDIEQFFRGGDVTDINTLLQILRS
jgi:hypothetical protein